ncbi:MAG: hypothetical protein ACLTZI_12910 [[Eubacterium] siraeum]
MTYHYGDALPTFGAPEEADGYIFGGWSWYGTEGALSGQPDTMPASTLTAIGTTTKCYISYEFDGTVYGTKEVGKIGDTITLYRKADKGLLRCDRMVCRRYHCNRRQVCDACSRCYIQGDLIAQVL